MKHKNTFSSIVTKTTYNIYNKLNYKSIYFIYLIECILCKQQYTGKSETAFSIRLNNHCNDIYKTYKQEADKRFRLPSHNFNRDTKFTLEEQSKNTELNKSY